jgi:hypothetical protein
MIIFKALTIKNGSIHMFISLWTVAAALFVWIVDKTKCQVNAASILKTAVSLSLISHTIIMSGSCLTILLSQFANVYQISGFI